MGKKQFYHYLDHPHALQDVDDQQLAAILKECEDLDVPDPGTDYWNHFNANLQTKLDALPQKKPFWSRFQTPIWLALAAALILAFVLIRPGRNAGAPPHLDNVVDVAQSTQEVNLHFQELDDFSDDTLDLLLDLYVSDESAEEEEAYGLAENDYDLFIQAFDTQPGQSLDELIDEEISAEDLKALWDVEG